MAGYLFFLFPRGFSEMPFEVNGNGSIYGVSHERYLSALASSLPHTRPLSLLQEFHHGAANIVPVT